MHFVSRAEAHKLLIRPGSPASQRFDSWRNYEIERDLEDKFGEERCVTDWCPYNGRFCKVSSYVPYPHPPLKGALPVPPETDDPWRVWEPSMNVVLDESR